MRNNVISICKGIAIILMVLGHTEGPGFLMHIVYLFHMPIFFITAGYFFSRKYLSDPWTFVVKRFKGLYVPMVKWALFFLVIHNLMFKIGLLSEQYGNWENGVTHPYDLHAFLQRAVSIVTSMSGYDEFLAGAFWFFRALLISSILFMTLYYALDGRWKRLRGNGIVALICAGALGFALLKIGNGLKVVNVVQGGIRETWGVFFFGVGVLYRSYEHRIKEHWSLALVYLCILCIATQLGWHGMTLSPWVQDVATLPLTGIVGFLMVHYVAKWLDRHDGIVKRALVHCGEMTLYIYVFHIISFKVVSAIKIAYYGLDWGQMGCHMVVHENSKTDIFWIFYTIAGTALPLLWMWAYKKVIPPLNTRLKICISKYMSINQK